MIAFDTPHHLAQAITPDLPVFCFRPERIKTAAKWFLETYPADPFYAVKANPAPHVLDALWEAGIRNFDVASAFECELIATRFPEARMAFLHPVKNRRAIHRAYHAFGVRIFVLDTFDELQKILDETGNATDLTLIVRIGVSNSGATLPLTGKFGANEVDAPDLLRAARAHADELGVSFHVGSQAMNPAAWVTAMADLSRIIISAGVTVDIVDVGGGFPAIYADTPPPSMDTYAAYVTDAFEEMMVLENADLWCEPGRALVAGCESLLTRIDLAKPGAIYLNDGAFGALYDAVHERWKFPMRALSGDGRKLGGETAAYTVYGPTCDSADKFPDPVQLPADLREGDYIEFGNIGAYGRSMAGRFNGFGASETLIVRDDPWPNLYSAPGSEIIVLGDIATV